MTLQDVSNGPDIIMWIVFAFLALVSIVFLTGHGAGLIAGYNTASEEEKSKYDEKKMCRVTGAGMSVVTILIFIMAKWQAVLPASFAYVALGIIIIDVVVMIIALNVFCKKDK